MQAERNQSESGQSRDNAESPSNCTGLPHDISGEKVLCQQRSASGTSSIQHGSNGGDRPATLRQELSQEGECTEQGDDEAATPPDLQSSQVALVDRRRNDLPDITSLTIGPGLPCRHADVTKRTACGISANGTRSLRPVPLLPNTL